MSGIRGGKKIIKQEEFTHEEVLGHFKVILDENERLENIEDEVDSLKYVLDRLNLQKKAIKLMARELLWSGCIYEDTFKNKKTYIVRTPVNPQNTEDELIEFFIERAGEK